MKLTTYGILLFAAISTTCFCASGVVVSSPQVTSSLIAAAERESFKEAFVKYYTASVKGDSKSVDEFLVKPTSPIHVGRQIDPSVKMDEVVVTMIHYNLGWVNKSPALAALVYVLTVIR